MFFAWSFRGADVLMQSRNHCSFRECVEKKKEEAKLDASFEQNKLIAKEEVHRPARYGIFVVSLLFRFTAIISSICWCCYCCSCCSFILFQKILTFDVKTQESQTETFYWISIFHGLLSFKSTERRIIILYCCDGQQCVKLRF